MEWRFGWAVKAARASPPCRCHETGIAAIAFKSYGGGLLKKRDATFDFWLSKLASDRL